MARDDDDDDDRLGLDDDDDEKSSAKARPFLFGTAAFALLGSVFAAVSTSDFIEHLDRQVHSIHCSIIPGAGQQIGESGCRTIMMSPYSSMFRSSLWGGLPISLLAFAVFSYLAVRALDFALKRDLSKRDTIFLLTATALPVGMSLIYSYIAMSLVGAVCKLCVGIYISSGGSFLLALLSHAKADRKRGFNDTPSPPYVRWFAEGVIFVGVLALIYVGFAPTSEKSLEGCGTLAKKEDTNQIMLHFGGPPGSTKSIAVLDPLCPACKAFDHRMKASELDQKLNMDVVLFPLDKTCNWNVKESLHPGACAVAEAMLCDRENAKKILDYAFAHQEELVAEAKADEGKLRERLVRDFPGIKGCIGSAQAKLKVTKSLKWAVSNALAVLTPQLFIGDRRLCDEDTDLGLEYTVTAMVEHPVPMAKGKH
ncbi:MAG: vitamin K epoxide reductase family protein [Myxococcota bacterium]